MNGKIVFVSRRALPCAVGASVIWGPVPPIPVGAAARLVRLPPPA